jgi:hypothetical protein
MSWSCYLFEHHMRHYIYDEVVHPPPICSSFVTDLKKCEHCHALISPTKHNLLFLMSLTKQNLTDDNRGLGHAGSMNDIFDPLFFYNNQSVSWSVHRRFVSQSTVAVGQ